MTADIQAILTLLQRQTTSGPPAYSTVTSSPEYQRPAVRVQPVAAPQADLSLGPAPPRPQVPPTLSSASAPSLHTANILNISNNWCVLICTALSDQIIRHAVIIQ